MMFFLSRIILLAVHGFLLIEGFQIGGPWTSSFAAHSLSARQIPTDGTWTGHSHRKQQQSRLRYSPDDSFSRNEEDNSNSAGWIESLKARASQLDEQEERRIARWKNATCSSKVAVILPDWVRRLDVDYPLAVCGSSRGYLYVTHLETGEVLASNLKPENERERDDSEEEESSTSPENMEQTLRLLYGSFDGGGTLAVAFSGSRICSADRNGGVQLWGYDPDSKQLVSQGSMEALEGTLVVALQLDDEYLWVGSADGHLQGYPLDDDLPLALRKSPECSWKLSSALVSMHVDSELGCAVASTAYGKVELVSLEDESGQPFASFTPPFDSMERKSSNAFVQSCTFVAHSVDAGKNAQTQQYSVVCGGNDGSLFQQRLKLDEFGNVDTKKPFQKALKAYESRHLASVRSLSSPRPGIVVSGGQDSSLRVWDVNEMTFLYQFVGYKVWLSSIWSDGARIVSDGADNTIVVHDFDKEDDTSDSGNI